MNMSVLDALVPTGVAQSQRDPDNIAKIARLTTMVTGYERRDHAVKAGPATGSPSP